MRPADDDIMEIAARPEALRLLLQKMMTAPPNCPDVSAHAISLLRAYIEDRMVEVLDKLDGAELATKMLNAAKDRDGWFHKYLLEVDKVRALEAEITDLKYAAKGFKHYAEKVRPVEP